MTTQKKAKRKLSDIDFSKEDAHVALVHKDQGGPANGHDYSLILKSSNNFSPEFIQKMQQVQVTMELPDFLQKFFGVWDSDAEVLARLMGYVEPADEDEEEDDWWENYIEEKLSAFTIIKSLHEAKNLPEALSQLTEQDYLDVLTDQVEIEKALKSFDDKKSEASTKVEKQVEATASKKIKKEKVMTQEAEMVAKSELVAVEKAMSDQKVALEKALAQVKEYEEEKKQAIVKSKTDAVKAVVKDEKQAAVIVKAALALESQEDFEALVEVFKSLNELVEKSDAFKEIGVSAESGEDKPGETKLMKALKARHQVKQ